MNDLKITKVKSNYAFIKPFLYNKASMTTVSIRMIVLLLIQVLLLVLSNSYSAVIVISATFLGSVAAYLIRFIVSKEPFYSSLEIFLQGLMIGMLLPETYPPLVAFFISAFLLTLVRYILSSVYNVWANLIALGVVLAWFIGKNYFPQFLIPSELISMKNPSLTMIQKGIFPISSFDASVTYFLNDTIFHFFDINIPGGYISLMWDTHSVIPAFRFNIVTIVSSLFLFSDDGVEILIPSIFLFVYALLVRLFAPFVFGGAFNTGDVILAIFTSGTLFCSVFILQWFGTVPGSLCGKIIYAVLTGITAFAIVGSGTSSVGMVYTILLSNVYTVIIKVIEDNRSMVLMKKILTAKDEVYVK